MPQPLLFRRTPGLLHEHGIADRFHAHCGRIVWFVSVADGSSDMFKGLLLAGNARAGVALSDEGRIDT